MNPDAPLYQNLADELLEIADRRERHATREEHRRGPQSHEASMYLRGQANGMRFAAEALQELLAHEGHTYVHEAPPYLTAIDGGKTHG